MAREVWQAYDCPLSGIDFDLADGQMVHQGQRFRCAGCGHEHTAGVDVEVESFEDLDGSVFFPDLPATAEDLRCLRDGGAVSWRGTGDAMTNVPFVGDPPRG